jgi:hypothetical protein
MTTSTMKRVFLRTHRKGMVRQLDEKRQFGPGRNYRSPEGRSTLASNHAYRALHPEWSR